MWPRRVRSPEEYSVGVSPEKPMNTPAPPITGSDSRNEKRAADSRSRPRARLAVIVTPDRDTPGWSATAWASPM